MKHIRYSVNFSRRRMVVAFSFFVLWLAVLADLPAAEALVRREWKVDGVTREALIHIPKNEKGQTNVSPVVFAFHGHGGSMSNAAKMFHIETVWPEAIVVYMQGLN